MLRVVLFDGYCNLCSLTVDFINKHDTKNLYVLRSLQSPEGQMHLKNYKLSTTDFNTVILIENNQIYAKSTAVFMIVKNLTGTVKYLYVFIFIPRVVRDFVYDLVAKNRFSIFGKRKACKL